MESHQDMSGNDTENVVNEAAVMDSLGEPQEAVMQQDSNDPAGKSHGDSLSVQKRLKSQKRAHEREMREMQSRMDYMQSQLSQGNPQQQAQQSYAGGDTGVNDAIQQAVGYALQQKELAERKAHEMESQQRLARKYADLNRHLDATADKYDDFDEVVRGDAPFTAQMRDIALFLPKKGTGSAGEVFYNLGKNPEELSRISKLPPEEQAAEVIALSHALIQGAESKPSQARPLGQIKSNPIVNSTGVTDKTPVSDIRARMKKGTFK